MYFNALLIKMRAVFGGPHPLLQSVSYVTSTENKRHLSYPYLVVKTCIVRQCYIILWPNHTGTVWHPSFDFILGIVQFVYEMWEAEVCVAKLPSDRHSMVPLQFSSVAWHGWIPLWDWLRPVAPLCRDSIISYSTTFPGWRIELE